MTTVERAESIQQELGVRPFNRYVGLRCPAGLHASACGVRQVSMRRPAVSGGSPCVGLRCPAGLKALRHCSLGQRPRKVAGDTSACGVRQG